MPSPARITRPSAPVDRPAHLGSGPRYHARGFWVIGYVFASTMAFAGVPATLLVIGSSMLLLIAGSAVLLCTGRRRAHAGRGQGPKNAAP